MCDPATEIRVLTSALMRAMWLLDKERIERIRSDDKDSASRLERAMERIYEDIFQATGKEMERWT